MKNTLFLGFALLFAVLGLYSAAWGQDNCFNVTSSEWGNFCEGDKDSISLTVTNTCEKEYALSICIEKTNGEWDCTLVEVFEPGVEKVFGTCGSTGKYKLAQCFRIRGCNALELVP